MRWALYLTLAPAWFDPSEVTAGFLTPIMEAVGVIPPLGKLFPQWVRNLDSYKFGQRMMFCKATKIAD